ncbi:hypothetical protein G6F57_017099 [Rhizopus arrhizus]|nr:hypothetical protein G6F57_017099 [Rhizopus arrhizus]
MEGAGKLVDDEELREAMSERGLGTPATRAAIIEGLLNEVYLRREGRDLVPTAKARQLMTLLAGLDVTELTSPELTGEWEHKLKQIEQGGLGREAFMREIAQMTQVIVKRAKEYERDTVPGDYATLQTPCPKCGAVVKEIYRRFACTACDFSIGKHPGGRTFELPEVEELLAKREIAGGRFRPERRRRHRSRGLLRPHAGGPVPEVPVARVRARHELRLRKVRRPRKELRLPLGQGHPAARDLGPADGQALARRPHRPARRLRVQPHQPQVQGVPGAPARRQGGLRGRAAS